MALYLHRKTVKIHHFIVYIDINSTVQMSGYGLTTPTKNHPNERFNSTFHLNWQKSDKTSVATKSMPRRKKNTLWLSLKLATKNLKSIIGFIPQQTLEYFSILTLFRINLIIALKPFTGKIDLNQIEATSLWI